MYSSTLPDSISAFGLVYFTVLNSGRDTELLNEFNSKQADLNSRRIVCRIDGKRYAAAFRINALHSAPACRNWNKSPAFVSPFVCHEDFAVCNARSAACLCRCEHLPLSDLNRGYGITRSGKPSLQRCSWVHCRSPACLHVPEHARHRLVSRQEPQPIGL